jgi:hypothetical protein
MSYMRTSTEQIFDGKEAQLWHPVPGKRTLSQDLPVQRRASYGSDMAAVMAAVAPTGPTGPTGPAQPVVQRASAQGAAGPARGMEDPFALHLVSGSSAHDAAGGPVVQRKSSVAAALDGAGGAMESEAHAASAAPSGGGQALPEDVRAKMDAAFGFDFSSVRIHEGERAAELGALAYTQGSAIHFAPGQYDPHSERGQELLGHELTHVVQQSQGRVQATAQAKGAALNDDAGLEREADERGARAARGEQVASGGSHAAPVIGQHASQGGAEAMQLKRVTEAVPGEAVVTASSKGNWMIVQGLDAWGFAGWHLTIFPSNQERWKGTYALPASGKRGVGKWMEYDEFHLTFEGLHFFYTDGCVPLPGSQYVNGKSPPWTEEKWQWANWVCASYFHVSNEWLNEYVKSRPREEQQERQSSKMEEQHQERMWKRYKHWRMQCPEIYEKTKLTFEAWSERLVSGFQGSYEEFRAKILQEERECGGKLPDYPKREWRDDMVEMDGVMIAVYGYEEPKEEQQ